MRLPSTCISSSTRECPSHPGPSAPQGMPIPGSQLYEVAQGDPCLREGETGSYNWVVLEIAIIHGMHLVYTYSKDNPDIFRILNP